MDNYERQLLEEAIDLLHRIIGYADARADSRPVLRFVNDDRKEIPFPGTKQKPLAESQEANFLPIQNPDVGTSEETELGFVEFTEKEIQQMPKIFKNLIIVNRKRCRIRKHASGKNQMTYEIRFRQDGYDLSACGKTIELAKAKMLEKMKTAKPKDEQFSYNEIPKTFNAFAMYYFETFRKEKLAEKTYRNDLNRYNNHLKPHFGETLLKKITPLDCKTLLDKIKAAGKGKTADELHSLMSIIFKGAIAHGIIQRNPLDVILHVQHECESGSALTRLEEKILFEKIQRPIYRTAAALVLYCGLRPNELQHARINGFFIETVNSKRKNKKVEYKRIPIIDRLRPFLPEDGIFQPPNLELLREQIRLALPNHKLYDLRTTFYTRCKELGVSEHALKEFAGHSLGALGNAYTDLSDEYLLTEGKKLNKW